MKKSELLELAERLGTISPSEKSPEGLLADNLCLDISSFILRKLAALEPVARVSMCGSVGRLEWVAVKGQEDSTPGDLYNLTGIIDHE